MGISLKHVYRESGLGSVYATGRDAWIIILARSARMFAYGASSLVLALFFAELHVPDERIGLFMTLTLAGDVGLGLLLTLVADHVGRRRTLVFGSVLMILSGVTFALCENYWLLLAAAVVGVISATGGDFGPFRAVEESMLSELTDPTTRADVLVWYVTISVLGSSLGTELAGHVIQYLHAGPPAWSLLRAYHFCYWIYAAMGLLNLVFALGLTKHTELRRADEPPAAIALTARRPASHSGSSSDATSSSESLSIDSSKPRRSLHVARPGDDVSDSDSDDDADETQPALGRPTSPASPVTPIIPSPATPSPSKSRFSQISRQTRSIMYGLWFLLMVDSLADGMASMALTAYYMDSKFNLGKDSLGNVLSAAYFLAACSSVFAGPLSRAIGLVNTMVFTHVPSSAAVLLFPWPRSVALTYVLLLVRVGLNNLDQAPRAALIAAVVRPEERTAVMGITSMLRTLAATTGPSLTGLLAGGHRFWIAFVVAGALRLAYDLGLFVMFVNIRLYQHEPVGGPAAVDENNDDETRSTRDVLGHPDSFVLDEEESVGGSERR